MVTLATPGTNYHDFMIDANPKRVSGVELTAETRLDLIIIFIIYMY